MKNLTLLLLLSFTLSCAKDGRNGQDGLPGPQGDPGSANVISWNPITVYNFEWTATGNAWYVDLSVTSLTQDIVDSGIVMVYVLNGSTWTALPYTYGILTRVYQFSAGNVRVFYQNTDNSATTNPGTRTFRVVMIPSASLVQNLDYTRYQDVVNYYGLD